MGMAMDPKPTSPEISKSGQNYENVVGREFVRQYYTLLNQSPTYLHRFYATNSSFVHGALDPVYEGTDQLGDNEREVGTVYGQKDIHERIMQLNFQDCKTKIRQVDSHATIGNGVVVQVSGELSNSGQPMRRFMQTFVLEPQGPKKFYVRNDIFRYQDEVFSVTDACISSAHLDSEAQLSNSMGTFASLTMVETVPADSSTYASESACHGESMVNGSSKRNSAEILPLIGEGWMKNNQESSEAESLNENMYEAECPNQQESIPADSSTCILEPENQDESIALGAKRKSSESLSLSNNLKIKTDHDPQNAENDAKSDISNDEGPEEHKSPQDEVVPNQPKTYANLLKTGTSSANNQILNMNTGGGLPSAGFAKSDYGTSGNYQGRGSTSRNINGTYQGRAKPRGSQVGGYSSAARGGLAGTQNGGNFNQTRYENDDVRDGGISTPRSSRGRGRAGGSGNGTYQGPAKPKNNQVAGYSFSGNRGGLGSSQNGENFRQTRYENEDGRDGGTLTPRNSRGRGRTGPSTKI